MNYASPTAADFDPLIALYNSRRYVELENQVRALLAKHPNVAFAWQLLGGALQMQGKDALFAFQKTAELSPNDASAHFNLAVAFKSAEQLEQAAASYRRALALKPQYFEALSNLGNVLLSLGHLDEAVPCYRRALLIQPESAEIHYYLGNALSRLKQLEQAAQSYQQAVTFKPDFAAAHCNWGSVLKELGKLDEALARYRLAIKINPLFAEAHCNLGAVLQITGKANEALLCFQQAASINPNSAEIHNNLGFALYQLKQFDQAIASCQHAVMLNPSYAEAHNNLGLSFKAIGQLESAAASYRHAIACKQNFASAYSNLGNTQRELRQYDAAIASYKHAIAIQPDFAEAYNNLGNALNDSEQRSEAVSSYRQALSIKPDYFEAHSNLLMASNYTALSPADYLSEARRFGEQVAQKVTSRYTTWQCVAQPQTLRVGVVSADLHGHPVGYFLESLLAQLDPARIELIAYSNNPISDDLTARIKPYFSAWKPVFALNDQAAAQLIHNDGVHVLLDLSGHTAKNRLPMFAWKPAPVQVSWLGLPTTTGMAEMDYVLGDPIATPPEDAGHFSEQIWRLPETYICLTRPDAALAVKALPALSNGFITFGSLNNLAKMNDATVAVWARILAAVPHSRLLLKAHQLKDEMAITKTLQRFAAHGIGTERLILAPPTSQRSDHLATYHRVDIGLDPFPYPGVTTSAEALWMGVPVLSMQGDRFLSRTAASIAHNAGLPDWIATSEDDYVTKAIEFSQDVPRLAALRAGLREQVRTSPLFDAPRFARHFEQALWGMWQAKQERPV